MQLAVTCLRHQVSLELLLQHECQSVRDCSLFCFVLCQVITSLVRIINCNTKSKLGNEQISTQQIHVEAGVFLNPTTMS